MRTIKTSKLNDLCCKSQGYNLLMTSIALIVVGLIAAVMLNAYAVYERQQKVTQNQEIIANIINKVQNFKEIYGRFPCPSSLSAARGTAAYGREDCGTVITVGTCAGGICVTEGRTIAPSVTPEPIRTGAVPFRLLQLDEKASYDAYGSRLVYAMTQNLGTVATYSDMNGGIGLADENGGSLTDPDGSADYVVISQGPNKVGAYGVSGTQSIPCSTNLEAANCINQSSAPASPTTFVSSLAYLSGGVSEFDDSIEYFSTNESTRWRRNDTSADNIQTVSMTNVGVNTNDPDVTLDIGQNTPQAATIGKSVTWDGALRVTAVPVRPIPTDWPRLPNKTMDNRGRILADSYCNEDGTECFRIENFTTPGMTPCPAGKYMIGLQGTGTDAEPICSAVRIWCNPPLVLKGLTAAGAPICEAVSSNCLVGNVQVCNVSHSAIDLKSSTEAIAHSTSTINKPTVDAGAGTHNTTYQIFDPDSYLANRAWGNFKCVNGDWIKQGSQGGLCSCNPPLPPNNIDCTVNPSPSPSCTNGTNCAGQGTGTAIITNNFNTSACLWQQVGAASYASCTCSATPTTIAPALGACPGGYNTGNSPSTYTWNSNPNVCDWQGSGNTCACNPALATPPAAGGGDVRVSMAPADTVACSSIPGFQGYTGNAYKKYKFNATVGGPTGCQWLFDGYDTSACLCDTTTRTGQDGASTCNAACQKEDTKARDWFKNVNPGCVRTPDGSDPSVCSPKKFEWQIDPSSPPLTGESSHGPIAVADECNQNCMTNNVQGSSDTCWLPDTGGKYKIYTCICKPKG